MPAGRRPAKVTVARRWPAQAVHSGRAPAYDRPVPINSRQALHVEDPESSGGADGAGASRRRPEPGREAPCRDAARGAFRRGEARRLPGAGADDLLSALVDGGSGQDRRLFRARDAERGGAPALRDRPVARHRLPSRLCRAHRRERRSEALQHRDPRGARRQDHRPLSQDPSAGPFRASAQGAVSASREALFRRRQRGLQGLAHRRRQYRHVHLQRPALARDLPRHGAAGRRARRARLQHADPQHPSRREGASAGVPQPSDDAGRRLSERHLGRAHRRNAAPRTASP